MVLLSSTLQQHQCHAAGAGGDLCGSTRRVLLCGPRSWGPGVAVLALGFWGCPWQALRGRGRHRLFLHLFGGDH